MATEWILCKYCQGSIGWMKDQPRHIRRCRKQAMLDRLTGHTEKPEQPDFLFMTHNHYRQYYDAILESKS